MDVYLGLGSNLGDRRDNLARALRALAAHELELVRVSPLVESPALPESPEYPRRIYTLVALSLALGLLYGIARLVVATIEDHQQ